MAAKTNPEVIEGEYIDPDTSAETNGTQRRKRSAQAGTEGSAGDDGPD